MNKKFLLILLSALLVLCCVLSVAALTPPKVDGISVLSGHPSSDAAEQITSLANIQYDLGYFSGLVPRVIVYSGNTVFLFANLSTNGFPLVDNGDGTFTFGSTSIRSYQIRLGTNGFGLIQTSYVYSFNSSDLIASWDNSTSRLVFNSDYVGGSDYQEYNDLYLDWVEYYSSIINYEQNLESSYDQGVADGGASQYREGYDDGYSDGLSDGFDTGYSDGFSTGYSSGLSIGQASGLQQGRQEGYDTGYSEGFQDGLETGYLSGKSDGYIQGNQEGFQVGLTQGRQEGYETGFDDGYESGFDDGYETGYSDGLSAGGGSAEVPSLYTVKYINASFESSDLFLYIFWDGRNLDSLVMSTLDDMPAGYLFYTTEEYFYPSQVLVPSSISFEIPEVIRERFPQFEVGYISFVPHSLNNAECYLYVDNYDAGYFKGLSDGGNIIDGIGSVAAAPVSALRQALDFEIFGVNISKVVVGILAVCIAWIAWKLFRKFIPV